MHRDKTEMKSLRGRNAKTVEPDLHYDGTFVWKSHLSKKKCIYLLRVMYSVLLRIYGRV